MKLDQLGSKRLRKEELELADLAFEKSQSEPFALTTNSASDSSFYEMLSTKVEEKLNDASTKYGFNFVE